MFPKITLKSNMDRFIVIDFHNVTPLLFTLKSNMDRFIALLHNTNGFGTQSFKIQYG